MYNEELKISFIKAYTSSINTANVATGVFNAFEKYETGWEADLCTKSKEELQPAVDEITGLRSKSKWMTLTILKEYVKWCVVMKVPGARDDMLQIEVVGLEKVRRQMVASPLHLQKYLDNLFEPESEETIDNVYRCYYWMAYGGIKEADTLLVKNEDVDLVRMIIRYKNTSVPIYREAVPAFKNVLELKEFSYKHPKYDKVIRRDRVPGDTIMRGIKANVKTMTIRSTLSHRSTDALNAHKTNLQLSFYRIWISGLFYRMYERERAGAKINFAQEAVRFMEGKEYKFAKKEQLQYRQNQIARDYMEDYRRWKLAFSI